MTLQELVEEIGQQPYWERDGKRAPHKPLTLLFALGQAMQGKRMNRFEQAEETLCQLLDRFGPPRADHHPEQPVWRLRHHRGAPTSFWQLEGDLAGLEGRGGNPRLPLMRAQVSFGLSESAWRTLCAEPGSAQMLASFLANEIVPSTLQQSLLDAVGVDAQASFSVMLATESNQLSASALTLVERTRVAGTRIYRDPAFSRKVLDAYDGSCAICSISPRLGSVRFGIEAAHIRWAQFNGPDEVQNGICLCKMHHEALDWGAVKIDESHKVRVSSRVDGSDESAAMFQRYEGRQIRLPRDVRLRPSEEMLVWHRTEVFKP